MDRTVDADVAPLFGYGERTELGGCLARGGGKRS
jgi:hypothetical protein